MFEIINKVAIVTGGASGIGLAVARELLLNKAKGVAIADIDSKNGQKVLEDLTKEFGKGKIIFIVTDVSDRKCFEDAFKRTLHEFKSIDILVNNAGIIDEIQYEHLIAVNLLGISHGILLSLDYLSKYKTGTEGVIINTSSIAGIYPVYTVPIYSAAKAGVVSLTLSFGDEALYKKNNIKVVAVAPGATESNILNTMTPEDPNWPILQQLLRESKVQTAEFEAKNMINIIREKKSGTVWIVTENKEAFQYVPSEIPHSCNDHMEISEEERNK